MSSRNWLWLVPALTAVLSGCGGSDGPELADVYGIVTMDGAPLVHASITFIPKDGRPSYGATDESGRYRLKFTEGKNGAVIGDHTVRISTRRGADPDSGVKAQDEKIPARFNAKSDLVKKIVAGSNEINIDVDSKRSK